MLNVATLITDPDFCTSFKIIRKMPGKWEKGKITETIKEMEVVGIVSAVNSKDMEMLTEGDRTNELKTFYSLNAICLTDDKTTSDICVFEGGQYRIIRIYDYSKYGYYKAVGTRIGGV